MLGFGADGQERILETSLVKNGGQKELLPQGWEEWSTLYLKGGQGWCKSLRNFGNKVSRTLRN